MVGGLRCVVMPVKCDTNRLRGYGAVGDRKWPFPITLASGLYNSLYYRVYIYRPWFVYFWSRVSDVITVRRSCGIEYCDCVCVSCMLFYVCSFACEVYEYEYRHNMNNLWKPSNLTVLELRELEPEIIFAHFILAIFFRRSFEIIIFVLFAAFSLISNIWSGENHEMKCTRILSVYSIFIRRFCTCSKNVKIMSLYLGNAACFSCTAHCNNYLRQGGYVFAPVCFSVRPSSITQKAIDEFRWYFYWGCDEWMTTNCWILMIRAQWHSRIFRKNFYHFRIEAIVRIITDDPRSCQIFIKFFWDRIYC